MHQREENLLLVMINAALAAGKAILEVKKGHFSVCEKADASPVTDADLAAQEAILQMLAPLGIPVISEESPLVDYAVRKTWDEVFVVDPLDGTKEFVDGSPQYGVNIALIRKGTPVTGVIFLPEDCLVYLGGENFPAACAVCSPEERFSSLSQIERTPLPGKDAPDHYILLVSKSHQTPEMKQYLADFRRTNPQAEILPMASCLKYCVLAQGFAHQYTRYGSVMEWDTAAGDALLRSQKLPLRSIHSGEPLRYNKEMLFSSDFTVQRIEKPMV